MSYRFTTPVWQTKGNTPWFFISVPPAMADEIDQRTEGRQGGFGSVKVSVRIGETTWTTSVFPSKEAETYILPVKKSVRVAERLGEGTAAEVELSIVGLD